MNSLQLTSRSECKFANLRNHGLNMCVRFENCAQIEIGRSCEFLFWVYAHLLNMSPGLLHIPVDRGLFPGSQWRFVERVFACFVVHRPCPASASLSCRPGSNRRNYGIPGFEDVFVGLKIEVKTTPWPMYTSFAFRLHEHDNHGLKMFALI